MGEETLEQFIRHYLTRQELESMRGQVETDLTKMLYKKLSDESVGTKISHKIMEKVLEKMQSGMAGVVGSTLGLNQMAEPQRVYILSSDLEADRNANRVQVEETTF